MLTAWSRAFPEKQNGLTVIEAVGHLSTSVRLLVAEINTSARLRSGAKQSVRIVAEGLGEVLRPMSLLQSFQGNAPKFTTFNLGVLESAGASLAQDFPKPELTDDDAKKFYGQLTALAAEIGRSSFPADMKWMLDRYIGLLLWAIENQQTVTAAMVRDAAGNILMSVTEASALVAKRDDSTSRS